MCRYNCHIIINIKFFFFFDESPHDIKSIAFQFRMCASGDFRGITVDSEMKITCLKSMTIGINADNF